MCLPRLGRIIEIAESEAIIDVEGVYSTVNVMCVPHVVPGDHVMIHAGYAVSILTSAEAEERQALLDAVQTGVSHSPSDGSKATEPAQLTAHS